MKVGLFINTQYPEDVDVPAQIPALVEQVRVARDAGYKSLWFPHHWLTAPMQMLQIMPAMAFLAAEAKGMVIGPNILILPLLNPMHVAEEAATLDVLTGGNYVLGAGLGYREPEFTAFGIPLSERAGRFTESVTLMRKLWAGGKITHEGKFFNVRDAGISVKPARPGGVPIYIAGLVDASVRRAARIGDAWLIANASSIQEIMPQMKTYRAALTEFGRTPVFTASEFEAMGYRMIIWPVSTLRIAAKAHEDLLNAIVQDGGAQNMVGRMQTRVELYKTIHYHDYESLDASIVETVTPLATPDR